MNAQQVDAASLEMAHRVTSHAQRLPQRFRWGYINTVVLLGVLLYVAILVVPLFLAFSYSLTNWNLLNATSDFVGWQNYIRLASDDTFTSTLLFTIKISILVTFAANILGLGVAMALNRPGALTAFLRTVFFLPQVLSAVVISFIWGGMLTSDRGLVNTLLHQLQVLPLDVNIPWLGTPDLAFLSVVVVCTWQSLGFCVVVYLAALQGIPQDLRDAAYVDGANRWQEFRHVIFPLLSPGITINVVLLLIIMFKLYDVVAVLTAAGPGGTTESLAYYITRMAFTANKIGYASTMAVVLFLCMAVVSATLGAFLRSREVEY
jgi:multiple sugar transport system permease protein